MEIKFKIVNDHISIEKMTAAPVADSVNHLYAAFEFDDYWDGCVRTAVFGNGKATYHAILKEDNRCVIPWEVLCGRLFTVSVFGIRGSERITATQLKIPLAESGYKDGNPSGEPSDSAYTQLLQMMDWVIANKTELIKLAQGSTDVPNMINFPNGDTLAEALDAKADRFTASGGFAAGENAAVEWDGAAIGKEAEVTKSDNKYGRGFAGGYRAKSKNGGASGSLANTFNGGSAGNAAYSYNGGAVGSGAKTTNGFAGGDSAICENNSGIIDAVQLGTGKNDSVKTFQVYNYRIMNSDGTIPTARMSLMNGVIDNKIAEAKAIIPKRHLVQTLPTANIDTNGTYLVPSEISNENNIYTEYAYINGAWEIIGSPFEVDLSDYYTKAETDGLITSIDNTLDKLDVDISLLDNGKADKCNIDFVEETTLELLHNTERRCIDTPASITLTLPQNRPRDYKSSVVFTSGTTSTNLTYPNTIKMLGEDCMNGIFTPAANKRYKIAIAYDGLYYVGTVTGFEV